jgi:hypothetical protein
MATIIKLKRGTTTPTTSNITSGEVAVDTSAQKLYINDSGTVKEIGGGSAGNTFSTISVSGQSDVVADSSTDTLTLVASDFTAISTNAGTDTVTIGNADSKVPFTKADGSTSNIELQSSGSTLGTFLDELYVPFTKADGSSVTTLQLG